MLKTAIRIASGAGMLILLMGAGFAVEEYFAKEKPTQKTFELVQSDIKAVNTKIEIRDLKYDRTVEREHLYELEDRWSDRFYKQHDEYPDSKDELLAYMTQEARDDYRSTLDRIEKLTEEINEKNEKKGSD